MDRTTFRIAVIAAALMSFPGPAHARRGLIWIPTSGTGLAVFIGIIVLFLLITGALKLMRKGAKVAVDNSTAIAREAGTLARNAVEREESTSGGWADKLGAKLEQRAASGERDGAGARPGVPSRAAAAAPAARPVRTASLAAGPRSSPGFGKR